MKVALDISPLNNKQTLGHRVRGTGFYIENLKKSLLRYFPENEYIFFSRGDTLPNDIDIIHYPYFEPFFLSLPFRKNSKTIVTVHDLTPLVFKDHFPSGIRGKIKWLIQKRSLAKMDAIITDSESSKRDIVKYANIPSSKVIVIYLSAGEEFIKVNLLANNIKQKIQEIRKKYQLPERFILYVGDVTWNKNLPRLILAAKKAKIPLVLVGKAITEKKFDERNPWNQDLKHVQKLIEQDSIILSLGFVPSEDLVFLYNIASVFCMPSLYEGFGLPILEAMSSGCPVITTKQGSLPEVAGKAAFYVDPYDTTNIAKGLEKVFLDKKLQNTLSESGLEQSRKFSWKKTVSQTMDIYESI